jgi:hypothetical protein
MLRMEFLFIPTLKLIALPDKRVSWYQAADMCDSSRNIIVDRLSTQPFPTFAFGLGRVFICLVLFSDLITINSLVTLIFVNRI